MGGTNPGGLAPGTVRADLWPGDGPQPGARLRRTETAALEIGLWFKAEDCGLRARHRRLVFE